MAESLWKRLAPIPLEIERYELERLEQPVTRGFTRVTTVVHLRGGGEEGLGEDVTWYAEHHDREQAAGAGAAARRLWTLESFSDALEMDDAAPALGLRERRARPGAAPGRDDARRGRRARAAAGRVRDLARARRPADEHGRPPLARARPDHRFKLDPASDWTDDLIAELAGTGAVVTADYKAYYSAERDPPPDADLYRRVAEGFPEAFLEDPALTDETELVLAQHRERVTWDAPIHSVADVEALAFPPRVLNSKPSRFGRLSELLAFYAHCEANGIGLYGGGMFELGPGPRADPVPRLALPRGRAERRRAARVQRPRAAARPAVEPDRAGARAHGVSLDATPPLLFD